ncbi:hypothetical protein [Croceicoccus mobilis]|uniref:Terminase n=1 Tax=Croceicoccus mobilis TaxID=1703339 RepID=A0A916YXF1_9SPHN|nr:hypothetical protein [Croceicoccus mobilis]GGD64455.1 hypothetical protein GCM10010990_12370 [Croceicoccus mobilis]
MPKPHHTAATDTAPFPFTPLPRATHGKFTAQRQRHFIAALAATGFVGDAARACGVSEAAVYKARNAPAGKSFRAAWDAARMSDTALAARAERWRAKARTHAAAAKGQLACASARPAQRTSRTAFTAPEPDANDPLLRFAPFVHPAPRRNSITPDRQRGFIAALAASGSVRQAARSIGASMEALYKLRARHGAEEFAQAWEKAIDLGIARLEDTALARALEGEARPIVSHGEVIGEYRKHNEALVMFLLRHRRSQRYGGAHAAAQPNPAAQERALIASINAKLDRAHAQWKARQALRDAPGGGGELRQINPPSPIATPKHLAMAREGGITL